MYPSSITDPRWPSTPPPTPRPPSPTYQSSRAALGLHQPNPQRASRFGTLLSPCDPEPNFPRRGTFTPRPQSASSNTYRSAKREDDRYASVRAQRHQEHMDAQQQAMLIAERDMTLKQMEERQRKAQATGWLKESERLAAEAVYKQDGRRRADDNSFARPPASPLTDLPWSSSSPNPYFQPSSAAYWRLPTATGLNRPEPPPHGQEQNAPRQGYNSAWRQAQEEARYVIKAEQDRLERLFTSESESLKRIEEALGRRPRDDPDYDERLLADEERRVQLERNRVARLRADNTEWLSHLIKQETDRIHAAMIQDKLEDRLTPEESHWLENNITKRKSKEEERQRLQRVKDKEAERLRELEGEGEEAKLRAVLAEELTQAARQGCIAPPSSPASEGPPALYSNAPFVSVTLSENIANETAHGQLDASTLPHSPQRSPQRVSATLNESRTYDTNATLTDEELSIPTAGPARRTWTDDPMFEWDRRNTSADSHHLSPQSAHHRRTQSQSTPSSPYRYRYRPASAEAIATPEATTAARRAEEIRLYGGDQEKIEYRERQAARAAREMKEAAAARKAFEEERKILEEDRRKKEDEHRDHEEQIVIAAWQRYERGWHELLSTAGTAGGQLTFFEVPWPVIVPARSLEDLRLDAIEKFLLSPCHSPAKTPKMRLDDALNRWQPTSFAHSFYDRTNKSFWSEILTGINLVADAIKSLINKPGVAIDKPSELDAWNLYQSRWSALSATSPSQPISFEDVPWPLWRVPTGPESITLSAVGSFILSFSDSKNEGRKARLRNAMRLWHLDKFQGRWMNRIEEKERSKVMECVEKVHIYLVKLMRGQAPDSTPARVFIPISPIQSHSNHATTFHQATQAEDQPAYTVPDPPSRSDVPQLETDRPDDHRADSLTGQLRPSSEARNEPGALNNSKPRDSVASSEQMSKIAEILLRTEPISRQTPVSEVISHLVIHGCRDLTHTIDHSTLSEYAISKGGFSDVHRARLGPTQIAVKILRISISSLAESPKHLKHTARELHTWSKCKHPNVLPLLGFGVFRGGIGMISPWMGQGTLPRYLERKPAVDRCNLCAQICVGLSYLHEIEIIHGDLKGANVLISDDGIPVLTDFGNSMHADQSMRFTQTTSDKSLTLHWSAPELIAGSGANSKAADVYALGMTIYEVMAGTIPYAGKNHHQMLLFAVLKWEAPERPKGIPVGYGDGDKLWDLLVSCWSLEPAARPNASEVATMMKTIKPNGLGPNV